MKKSLQNRIKRCAVVAAAVGFATGLSGCGASVAVRSYTENGVRYNEYTLSIETAVVQKMEKTASQKENGGKYTVNDYFFELFSGFDCEIVNAIYDENAYVATYRKAFASTQNADSHDYLCSSKLDDISNYVSFTASSVSGPFVRHVTSTSSNPFNDLRKNYDAVRPDESATVLQRIKNGHFSRDADTGERIVFLPSISEAFPALDGVEPDGLKLDYRYVGSKRMDSSGNTLASDKDNAMYEFSRYFDTADYQMTFEYDRPVPYGWYVTAILVGGVTFGVIMLITRTKKQKPTLLDRFPYNPQEYRDYDSNLPFKM